MGISIGVWSSFYRGQGASTVAFSLATILENLSEKKILIIDLSDEKSLMDQFVQGDISFSNNIDDIKVFSKELSSDIICSYSTKINDNLYMIKKSNRNLKCDTSHYISMIELAKEKFDIVVVKLETGVNDENKKMFNNLDYLMHVIVANPILIENISNKKEIVNIISSKNVFNVVNKNISEYEIDKYIKKRFENINSQNKTYILPNDDELYAEANYDRKLYTYIIKSLELGTDFGSVLRRGCIDILKKSNIEVKPNDKRRFRDKWKLKLF